VGDYRLYLFNGDRARGQRITRAVLLTAETDDEALAEADKQREGGRAELWNLERLVKIFDPDAGV
jgi:hypothetical protein